MNRAGSGALLGAGMALAGSVAKVAGIALLVFVLLRVVPGDLVDLVASEGGFTTTMMEDLRRSMGLDQPWWTQFGLWARQALAGDFGLSLRFQKPIAEMVGAAIPVTLQLATACFAVGMVLGVTLAVLAAMFPRTSIRAAVEALNVWSIAVPTFCAAFLLILIFVLGLRWASLTGNIWLPALVVGIDIAGQIAKPLLEDIEEAATGPYARAAAAKGLSHGAVILRHVLPNALSTLLALSGLVLGGLAGGTVTMEVLFGHHGLGRLTLDSVLSRDYPVTQATSVLIATAVVLTNGLIGALARLVDPRQRRAQPGR